MTWQQHTDKLGYLTLEGEGVFLQVVGQLCHKQQAADEILAFLNDGTPLPSDWRLEIRGAAPFVCCYDRLGCHVSYYSWQTREQIWQAKRLIRELFAGLDVINEDE